MSLGFTWRFVAVAAVSKDEQTIDKASIPSQLEITKQAGQRLGGIFVAEYVIDGYSRTAYWDLTAAMNDIPPLKAAIDAIHSYDVLILKNFDRLGSLGMPLYYYFNQYRKQLYSVQQATQIHDPETYNPAADIAVPSMIISASQNQVYRIAKISDAFTVGIKKRYLDGYYTRRLPYGYTSSDGKNATIVPLVAGLLVKFPEWFLMGKSINRIAKLANETGVLSRKGKRWVVSPVINILQNPFYAGKVVFERGSSKGGSYQLHKNVEYVDGKHEPLWSWDTHLRIMDEFKRREEHHATRRDYNLSGCMNCGVCGKRLWIAYDKHKDNRHYWKCPSHVYVRDYKIEKQIADQLIALYSSDAPLPSSEIDTAKVTDRELQALRRRMAKLDEENEAGAYTVDEFVAKRKQYKIREAELLDAERQREEAESRANDRQQLTLTMREIAQAFPRWLVEHDPSEVRHLLSRTVKITVMPDKTARVERI